MDILVAGCSHSCYDYEAKNGDGFFDVFASMISGNVINVSEKGISNELILHRVYKELYERKPGCVLLQLTYLHRLSFYYKDIRNFIALQPSKTKFDFILETDWTKKHIKRKDIHNELSADTIDSILEFYNNYLVYGFDEIIEAENLLLQLNVLKDYCKFNNIKLMILWYDEYVPIDNLIFQNLPIVSIHNESSIHNWQVDNNLYIGEQNYHLKKEGHLLLANAIIEKWKRLE